MNQSLYPKERYPQGHPDLARSLNNLGTLLWAQGSVVEARGHLERALAMLQSLYPNDRYPRGHPHLAQSLNNLGAVLEVQGSYCEARPYYERARAMHESLYPNDRYPQGQPELAQSLDNLGAQLQAQGLYVEAAVFLRQGADMELALSRTLMAATSESDAMSYLAQLPLVRDFLISVSLHVPASNDETYRRTWNGRSAVTQILHDRQAATLGRAGSDPAIQRTVMAWRDARSRLARLILATSDGSDHPERVAMIKALGVEKERLERELAADLPEFARKRAQEQGRHGDLLKIPPPRTAVLDLLRFTRVEQDPQVKGRKGERRTPGYVGIVLSKGGPVRMVDLGSAQLIEIAVSRWRQAIIRGQDSPAAADLRKLVWQPLAHHFPKGTAAVFLAPDGSLCFVPWAALPGDRPGTVLLEQYALATIPRAPFLLNRLTAPRPTGRCNAPGPLPAVGGVSFGQKPKSVDDERTRVQLRIARPAEKRRGGETGWAELPGTLEELDAVSRLAATREILRLQATEASTARLLPNQGGT
jgi:tetratricopeptide (TPR) repeat protein